MGQELIFKFRDCPFSQVAQIHEDAPTVYSGIESLHGDPAPLKAIVDSYVREVKALLSLENELGGRISQQV